MEYQKSNVRNFLVKPASAAGIVAAASYAWRGNAEVEVPYVGTFPYPLVAAAGTFLASEVVGVIEKYALTEVPVINLFQQPAKAALNMGAVAASTMAIDKLIVPGILQQKPLPEYLAFAVLGELGATYLTDQLIIPQWNQWMPENRIGE